MNNDILPGFDEDKCDSLTIGLQKVEGVDDCLALKVRGHIDTYSSPYFQRSVKKAIEAGFANLLLLFDEVEYISSTGVGALLQLQKAARNNGGDIAMVDVRPKIMEIFRLMCLEKFFSCADTMDEAIAPRKRQERPATFPRAVHCPICRKRLRVSRSGRFRCSACKTVLAIDDSGAPSIG